MEENSNFLKSDFYEYIETDGIWTNDSVKTMQMNITRKCNLACKHCHVESGPQRDEDISREMAEKCLKLFKREGFKVLDLTGGAPEMSSQFKYIIDRASEFAQKIIVRSNLTIHKLPAYRGYLDFMKDKKVEIVASLPFYQRDKTDRQRGIGVYDESIEVLRRLSKMGYGWKDGYVINLVYNPNGAILPGDQQGLEEIYRKKLKEYGISFNKLFIITNNPIGRFYDWLKRSGNLEGYMNKLREAFNLENLQNLMCREMISIDYDGKIYDCDFNLALGIGVIDSPTEVDEALKNGLVKRKIRMANHCFGCTAGSGSS